MDSHALGLKLLLSEGADVDWLYISPSGNFVQGGRTGKYETASHGSWDDTITYADLAVAILDEVERSTHRHTHLAVRS